MVPSVCKLQSQINDLRYGVVTVRSPSGVSRSYIASADSGTARMDALEEALASVADGDEVTLRQGAFTIPEGEPMTSFVPDGVTGVKLVCELGATHEYVDPEDAAADHPLFTYPKRVSDYGLREKNPDGSNADNWKALQAAANGMPPRPDMLRLASDRYLKNGSAITLPQGVFYSSKQWEISPCTVVRAESIGTINTVLRPLPDSFDPGDTFIKMEDAKIVSGTPTFSRNNCFGAIWSGIRIDQVERDANPGLNGMYWYGAQLTEFSRSSINNFDGYGLTMYGGVIGFAWITNCSLTGLRWTGGGTAHLLSIERCNPDQIEDPDTSEQYPWVDVSDGSFHFDFIQSEDAPPLTDSVTLLWAHDVTSLTVSTMYMGSNGSDTRTHTMVLLTDTCHNVNLSAILCFPNTAQTLVNDLSQQSPNGPGVQYLLTGNTGQYDQISGGLPGGLKRNQTWLGLNTFNLQTVFGTDAATNSFLFKSVNGQIDLGDGRIEGTRSTFFINAAVPKPLNVNNGTFTVSTLGVVDAAGEYRVDGVKVLGNQGAAVADASGGAVVDAEARTAINAVLARLRAHGTIAT